MTGASQQAVTGRCARHGTVTSWPCQRTSLNKHRAAPQGRTAGRHRLSTCGSASSPRLRSCESRPSGPKTDMLWPVSHLTTGRGKTAAWAWAQSGVHDRRPAPTALRTETPCPRNGPTVRKSRGTAGSRGGSGGEDVRRNVKTCRHVHGDAASRQGA